MFGRYITLLVCLGCAQLANGASIDMGNHILLSNTSGQVIPIYGRGGESVVGMDLHFSVEPTDGTWPRITGVTSGGPDLLLGGSGYRHFAIRSDGREASADSLLAETDEVALTDALPVVLLTFDTTGIFAGPTEKSYKLLPTVWGHYTWFLSNSIRDTFDLYPELIDGSLTIPSVALLQVPEPSTFALAVIAIAAGAAVCNRRRGFRAG